MEIEEPFRHHIQMEATRREALRRDLVEKGLWPLERRIQWLKCLDKMIMEEKDVILNTLASEKGCSEHNALLSEYIPTRMAIREYIKTAEKILADEDRSRSSSLSFGNKKVTVRKEPMGVVGIISPFNFPFSLPLIPVAAALVAGNAVLLKPSDETPETNKLVEKLMRSSLEKFEVRNLFEMLPPVVQFGQALVACPQVHKIHFTGSVSAGKKIAIANAQVRLTPPTLELGGSNAALVLEDADIEEAAQVIAFARFSGLNCNSIKRVFVVEGRYEEFCQRLNKLVAKLGSHEVVQKLPDREKSNYWRFVQDASSSAEPHLDGAPPKILRFDRYNPDLLVLKEETFCPILPVVKVKDESEAIRRANDSAFGLGASVFTKDKNRFRRIAAQLNVGTVNDGDALTEFAQPQIPFGGRKDSGSGWTHGPEGLLDFVQLKTIIEEKKVLGCKAPKLQLYPWTQFKQRWLRRIIDVLIKFS